MSENLKSVILIFKKISKIRNEGELGYWKNEESYKNEVDILSKKYLEIQSKLNSLSMAILSKEIEAIEKQKVLNAELLTAKNNLKDAQDKRERQLRIQNLEKMLDDELLNIYPDLND